MGLGAKRDYVTTIAPIVDSLVADDHEVAVVAQQTDAVIGLNGRNCVQPSDTWRAGRRFGVGEAVELTSEGPDRSVAAIREAFEDPALGARAGERRALAR